MRRYEIKGAGKRSGRRRKRAHFTATEGEIRAQAEKDGMRVNGNMELPPQPPTVGQLEYAKDLGIAIPPDATKADLSCLISVIMDKDKPSTRRHREFARKYGVKTSEYIGKKRLFDCIYAVLAVPGRERELMSWFAFRVYRNRMQGADDAPIKYPDDPIILEIGEQLARDKKIVESVQCYNGRDLIWFGEWISPRGRLHTGGSKRTVAYKTVASLLKKKAICHQGSNRTSSSRPSREMKIGKTERERKGCFSIFIVTFIILCLSCFICVVGWNFCLTNAVQP